VRSGGVKAVFGIEHIQVRIVLRAAVVADRRIDAEQGNDGQAPVGVAHNHAVGRRQTCQAIGALEEFGVVLADLDSVFGNVLIGGHDGGAAGVAPENNLLDIGIFAQVDHSCLSLQQHLVHNAIVETARFVVGVVGAQYAIAAL
jgi:hypothetical protein